ncbi:hypothetical protein PTTG_09742 [Puccinia triticina 1-1 BBBD Race 1]|uniref:Retrotransposon gag domain-containing protein n=1 Tax=Puccinia triticina (isolate 1-1 / race 1 (BBBD)) TaxID=630390 RepID=A0A180G238_PUCT1|nr:hypothetical protein PTTG_09742 [Puccinia triticina 1-1 BBBD Race 1]
MSTCKSNTDPLIPITDPKKLARDIRRRARLAATLVVAQTIPVPTPSPLVDDIGPLPPALPSLDEPPFFPSEMQSRQGSSGNAEDPADMSHSDLIKAIMVIQQNTAKQLLATQKQFQDAQRAAQEAQAQAAANMLAVQKQARADVRVAQDQASSDRGATATRFAALKPIKSETGSTPRLASGSIDLEIFRVSDGPLFRGPFQEVEPFLKWIQGVQVFYAMKDVTHSDKKRLILGGLIAKTNLLSFYANKSPKFANKPWDEFKSRLFEFSLPTKWRTNLKRSINQLKMADTKTLLEFSTQARTIQSLLNFEKETLNDFALAEAVTFGLPDLLQVKSANFKYGEFESRMSGFYISLIKELALRLQTAPNPHSRLVGRGINKDHLWRIKSYLDSIGKCHFCKKHCGSPVGVCPGPIDGTQVEVPSSFVTPPKPANYIGPNTWTRGQAANRSGAGKPTGCPAGVAALSEEAPDLDKLLASCVAQINGQAEASLLGYDNPLDKINTKHELAALAGDPDAVTTTEGSNRLGDDKLVPEDQITFRCGSLLEDLFSSGPTEDEYVPVPPRTLH